MGKKRKLRDLMEKRDVGDAPALVICVGKKCASREESRAVAEDARAYVAGIQAPIRLEIAGCLHVCEKGPIAATYPDIKFKKHVDCEKAHALVDKLVRKSQG